MKKKKSHIYTKKGDHGQTLLGNGKKVSKASIVINAIGSLDELSCFMGLAFSYAKEQKKLSNLSKQMRRIQLELFKLGSIVAYATEEKNIVNNICKLESEIDDMEVALPELANFVLSENKISAYIHVARAICRRAERALVLLQNKDFDIGIAYLNRLSDWLFMAAYFADYCG